MQTVAEMLKQRVDEIDRYGGRSGTKEVAAEFGVPYKTLRRWITGISSPRVDQSDRIRRMLEQKGATAPMQVSEKPATYGNEKLQVLGQVSAGSVDFAGQSVYSIKGSSDIWENSPFWHYGQGEVIMLEISGDSMSPSYVDGELIACRKADTRRELKDGIPCVFRTGNNYTFKLLRKTQDGHFIGYPINPANKPVLFNSYDDVLVEYVVLGKIGFAGRRRRAA